MSRAALPPGPARETPIFGSAGHVGKDLPEFLARLGREFGDLATFHLGPRPVILVNRPEYVEDILVKHAAKFVKGRGSQRLAGLLLGQGLLTSEGPFHLRQRRLAQPAFHPRRLDGYAEAMVQFAREARDGWQDGEVRRVAHDMMEITLKVVARTLFSEDLSGRLRVIADSLTEFMRAFPIHLVPGSELLDHLPIASTKHTDHAGRELDRVVREIIAERRADPADRGDLLSMLMLARDTEGDGEGMSDDQVRDEALTLLLAGHETTANALSWALYSLSQNPHEYRRLFEEVDRVLGDREATRDDVESLDFAKRCFLEALRLYPPVWCMDRELTEEHELGGYLFPKGTLFFLSPLVTQRDHRFWDAPLVFRPDRFLPEEVKARHHYAFFAFSGGQRLCMGEKFALWEGALVLATLAQKWEFVYQENMPARLSAALTLRPGGFLPMTLRRRG